MWQWKRQLKMVHLRTTKHAYLLLMCFMVLILNCNAEINLQLLGSHLKENKALICPNEEEFMFACECTVKGDIGVLWRLVPLQNDFLLSTLNDKGHYHKDPVTYILSDRNITEDNISEDTYVSEVHINTNEIKEVIKQNGYFNISCLSPTTNESENITVVFAGVQNSPKVVSANRTQQNVLLVSWSTESNGVIYTIVTIRNKMNGVKSRCLVSSEITKVSLPIQGSDLYDVKVTIVDKCGKKISSEYFITRNTYKSTDLSEIVTPCVTILLVQQNTTTQVEDSAKTGLITVISVLATVLAVIILLIPAVVCFWWIMKKLSKAKVNQLKEMNFC